jgi:3-dehydroquinate dehydratase / shikimate dehydrogenase
MLSTTIQTKRLILRPWRQADLEPFAKLNADPRVMECMLSPLSREESDQMVARFSAHFSEYGWGLWAVSVPDVSDFIGFIGLSHVKYSASLIPAIEIGWRLAYDFWGKGFATEGAKASLKYAFETLNLNEIVSFTAVPNKRSANVMEKIGMQHIPEKDFDHPRIPEGHPLRRHLLYLMSKELYQKNNKVNV